MHPLLVMNVLIMVLDKCVAAGKVSEEEALECVEATDLHALQLALDGDLEGAIRLIKDTTKGYLIKLKGCTGECAACKDRSKHTQFFPQQPDSRQLLN